MMEKIDISAASVAEAVRKQMALATTKNKGLLDAGSERFVRSNGLYIIDRPACIRLYSAEGRTAVSAIISTGRVEGSVCTSFILSFSLASVSSFFYDVKRLNDGPSAQFYYVKNGVNVSIYLVPTTDYSITNITPLIETGGFTYHLARETLPEGAIEIAIS